MSALSKRTTMIWRIVLGVELLLLAMPITGLASVFAIYALGRAETSDGPSNFVILFLATVGIAGLWWLSMTYLVDGRAGLIKVHRSAWFAAGAGVFATALGLAAHFLEVNAYLSGLFWGVVGAPLLIPLAHLLAARFLGRERSP